MAQAARNSLARRSIAERIDALDWSGAEQSLSERGYAVTAPVLSPAECAELTALYSDASRFRSHIIMERSEEHTSELQSRFDLVCRLLLEKKKLKNDMYGTMSIRVYD